VDTIRSEPTECCNEPRFGVVTGIDRCRIIPRGLIRGHRQSLILRPSFKACFLPRSIQKACMQLRSEDLKRLIPRCRSCSRRPEMDRHGRYFSKKRSQWIERFQCRLCGSTCSLLPPGTLPYREAAVAQLQDCLDRFCQNPDLDRLSRAERALVQALEQNLPSLRQTLGNMLSLNAKTAPAFWREMRRHRTTNQILSLLGGFDTSLLKAYRCLDPRWKRAQFSRGSVPGSAESMPT
jgi:hypothetical protein